MYKTTVTVTEYDQNERITKVTETVEEYDLPIRVGDFGWPTTTSGQYYSPTQHLRS